MDAKLISQGRCPTATSSRRVDKQRRRPVHAVLERPRESLATERLRLRLKLKPADSKAATSVHNDNWFDLLAINYLSRSLQAATGLKSMLSGYEGLVETAATMSKKFDTKTQQELVIQALDSAIPKLILDMASLYCRNTSPPSPLCSLPGSSDLLRFLEQSNCVGMCINLCKMPSQAFIKDALGTPVSMVPNFEDMSCEMIFGQDPPAPNDDPALKQPCYKLCRANQMHTVKSSG
ncbi:hypothetical protein V6N11_059792 [Hibiscus sabdariffa]|uniref:Beta-carotene isomerase D27-like C-terminal domain-containing protein n=2 Tax=Hibiscus sabdariffa TaxID=183260 RepID=A0ABR2NYN7_9ROSI